MAELVLVRHGRTDWNAVRRIQGQAESELDHLGHAQAAAVAPVLAALDPAVLWSSDSARTRATAAYVAKETGLDPTYDARLREYSFGDHEGLLQEEFEAVDPAGFRAYRSLDWDAVPQIERQAAVADRMTAALADVLAETPEDGTAVVVSHGAAIRTAVAALLGWTPAQALSLLGMENCGFAVLRRLAGPDGWRLVAYNRTTPPPDFTESPPVG